MNSKKNISKKILFIRHGESLDDTYDEFGSWNNRELTPNGVLTAFKIIEDIQALHSYEIIYTSPLKRAQQTASIIGDKLELRIEEDPYLIERNTYGLLAGVNKDLANEKYPELNASFLSGQYIHGAERYKDFRLRIQKMLERLLSSQYNNIICITHGYVITEVIDTYTDKVRNSVGKGSMIEIQWDSNNLNKKAEITFSQNITFTQEDNIIESLALRKFTQE